MKYWVLRTAARIALVACWTLLPLLLVLSEGEGPRAESRQVRLPEASQAADGLVTSRLGTSRLGTSPGFGPATGTLDGRPYWAPPTPAKHARKAPGQTGGPLRILAKQPPTLRGPPSSVV